MMFGFCCCCALAGPEDPVSSSIVATTIVRSSLCFTKFSCADESARRVKRKRTIDFRIPDGALSPRQSSNPHRRAAIGLKGTGRPGKVGSVSGYRLGWRPESRICGIYPSQAKHGLVTSDPANPVKITRQMRTAAIADAPADKTRVVVVAVSAPVTGVINRIALLERSSPDAEAASA